MAGRADPGVSAAKRQLRALRGARHLTQAELAKLSGVGLRTLQRLEDPDAGWANVDTLGKLERTLNKDFGYFSDYIARENERLTKHESGPDEAALREARQLLAAAWERLGEPDLPNGETDEESGPSALPSA